MLLFEFLITHQNRIRFKAPLDGEKSYTYRVDYETYGHQLKSRL